MSDDALRTRKGFSWLAGRASRREYWINVAVLFGLSLALPGPPALRLVLTALLAVAQVRRVHDFGRTGWWALVAALAPMACFALWPVASQDVVVLVGVAIELALVVAIGAVPGTVSENRFGPPPPFTLRRVLTGR